MEQRNPRPEIWGGIECTINRLKSGYLDQLSLSGHYDRNDDLKAIASLGITTMRYPVLWEKHQPQKDAFIDFNWVATRLEELRALGIKPIAGLLHHGSGPEYTNLADPKFPEMLAAYAKEVATRFPWIESYTPVNEPLTTARFSGLYGLWYPHETNDVSFAVMLLNQLKGVVLSMNEIRKVNPAAKLVQTEDLGKTYSTPLLKYQAKWENHRRFLTYDILCGSFSKENPFWDYFMRLGIPASDLEFFAQNPCPPDLLGANYYVTSERYIDQRLNRYPKHTHGGNFIHTYADVEAVRINLRQPHGFQVLVKELWKRYQIPIAVTEAHLHCSREEQMKWFRDIYESCSILKIEGIDIRAVTAWSLLGAYGWNKLLTSDSSDYEHGAFDVSSGRIRPTAMVGMIQKIAATGRFESTLLDDPGWWKRNTRFFRGSAADQPDSMPTTPPILIIGKTGTLGQAFARICVMRSLAHVLIGRDETDISNPRQIKQALKKYKPWAVINAAGYVRVDEAENNRAQCFNENATGAENLAKACRQEGIHFMTFSSDLVFDGKKQFPYTESDCVGALNTYGESKIAAESAVLNAYPESIVIRTSAFFGPWDRHNFAHAVLTNIREEREFHVSDDIVSPTYVPHLVHAALDLLFDRESGLWHLANDGSISWYDFACDIAKRSGCDTRLIVLSKLPHAAERPSYSVLQSEKGMLMPPLNAALHDYLIESRWLVESL